MFPVYCITALFLKVLPQPWLSIRPNKSSIVNCRCWVLLPCSCSRYQTTLSGLSQKPFFVWCNLLCFTFDLYYCVLEINIREATKKILLKCSFGLVYFVAPKESILIVLSQIVLNLIIIGASGTRPQWSWEAQVCWGRPGTSWSPWRGARRRWCSWWSCWRC